MYGAQCTRTDTTIQIQSNETVATYLLARQTAIEYAAQKQPNVTTKRQRYALTHKILLFGEVKLFAF